MARQGNFFSVLIGEESEVDAADLAAKIEAERLRKEKERLKKEEERLKKEEEERRLNPHYVKSETVRGGGSGYRRNNGGYRRNNGGADGYQPNYKGNAGAEGYRRNNGPVANSTNGGGRGCGQEERTWGMGYSRPAPVANSTTGGNRGAENSRPQVAAAVPSVEDPLHFPDLGKKAVKA
ncbi:glycine-rich RNA-binding protein 8-like [Cornus florida]|uniref:glycine-rich RNA-binding protein 8-like n=1 Tax=Cornus florida TaxID=4283 RepID=UPI0028A0CFB7|nr:glycine-rich RNA-binding protein 8-like [Cornus florida]